MRITIIFLFLITFFTQINFAQENKYPCETDENYQKLNFWIGEWDVYDKDNNLVGHNKIEKILHDCAIIENWTSANGNKGKSFFYYNNYKNEWNQVWITENALRPGGTKEKKLIEEFEDGSLRFQGGYPYKGNPVLDRTTLSPLEDGRVKQLIEWSSDDGETWKESFLAYYVKKK